MSSRRSPTGPATFLTGFITTPLTTVTTGTVAVGTVTALAQIQLPPSGTANGNMAGRLMTTNDIVQITPRTVPLNSAGVPIIVQYARVAAVESSTVATATAIIEIAMLSSSSGASATAVANTWNLSVQLQKADL